MLPSPLDKHPFSGFYVKVFEVAGGDEKLKISPFPS
jgi:hypothetical protein